MDIPTQNYQTSRFQWGPVAAGTLFTIALTLVLTQFGNALGLSAMVPLREDPSIAKWGVIAIGVWILWIQLLSSLGGGYIAGRLRTPTAGAPVHDTELRDGFSGLITWAFSHVLIMVMVGIAAAFATYVALATDSYEDPTNLTNPEKNKLVIFAFTMTATTLLAGAAAWFAAAKGGEHRDKGTDFSDSITFRNR
jgi:hypothetical protein